MNWRLFCTILLFSFLTTGIISSDEIWEGNATQIRRGEFESEGYYAASNSFPNGTVVEVENIRNGKSVAVTVLKRIGDNPNLFLLLSSQAAQRLGINKGDVERVRVMIVPDFGSDVQPGAEELTSSQDPDINPNVGLPEAPSEEKAVEEVAKEEASRTEESGREEAAAEAAAAAAAATAKEQSPEEALIAEKASRDPQKGLYAEPREGESSIALDVETPQVETVEKEIEEPGLEEGAKPADVAETTLEPPRPDREALMAVEPSDPLPPERVEAVAEVTGAPEETLDPPRAEGSLEVAFIQEDPQLPRETTPETEVEPPDVGVGDEVAFSPSDPVLPDETDRTRPAESIDAPQPEQAYLVAFSPNDPEAPREEMAEAGEQPEATVEPPEIEVGERVALSPDEPEPLEEAEAERPEISDAPVTPVDVYVEEAEVVGVTEPRAEVAEREAEVPLRVEEEVAVTREREEPDVYAQPSLSGNLAMGRTFFVQLGAYSDEALARSLEATYSKNYPIEVAMATSGKRGIFRVLVGPLSKDESGTVLYWFRARGFRDAFVRSAH